MRTHKKAIIFFCLFFAAAVFAHAQVFKGEIIGGFNLTQVDGDQQSGYRKFGAHAGVGVMFPFHFKKGNENYPWAVSMEILLNQKGAKKQNYYHNVTDTNLVLPKGKYEYLLRLNYVSVPVIFHYNDRDRLTFGLGIAYNRMFSSTELEYDIQQTYDTVKQINPNDFTALADVRFRIWQQLKFGFRFEYSLFSLRTRSFPPNVYKPYVETRKQRNNSLTFYLVFMLNEKKSGNTKKREKVEKPYYY